MAVRIAERVSKSTFVQWKKRLKLMSREPYSLEYSMCIYKCGDCDCAKTRLLTEDEYPLVLFAMAKDGAVRYYAAIDRLKCQWKVYKEVERVLAELATAGVLD